MLIITQIHADPLTWVSYGLISSQLCDVHDEFIAEESGQLVTVSQYLFDTYNYRSVCIWGSANAGASQCRAACLTRFRLQALI